MSPLVRVAAAVAIAFALTGAVASPARLSPFQQLLEDRRAVESLLWQHRIWPSTNPGPKPQFSQAFPEALLQDRVHEDLLRSAALSAVWSRPISGKELQAELNRMATHTQDPLLLKQIFATLDNDPKRIAYTLALPALVDRRLHSWYAQDDRMHGSLRSEAERALSENARIGSARDGSGEYQEVEYALDRNTEARADAGRPNLEFLSQERWDELVGRLAGSFGISASSPAFAADLLSRVPLHQAGGLRDEMDRFVSMTVLQKSPDRLKLGLETWQKRSFEAWWDEAKATLDPASGIPSPYSYALPEMATTACQNDTWSGVRGPVPYPRKGNSMIWTGTEVIIWGGEGPFGYLNTGQRYDPATDTWTSIGIDASTPIARRDHTAVWTGTEMIVWGGSGQGVSYLGTGGRYDPLTNAWSAVNTDGTSPTPRRGHTALWTGTSMIVWGGLASAPAPSNYINTGAIYDPTNDSWTATRSDATAPQGREGHTAVWTGTEMIVWGGRRYWAQAPWQWGDLATGGRYNPSTDTWTSMGGSPPGARSRNSAVWTGSEFIVWGGIHRDMSFQGQPIDTYLNSGGRYNPSTDSWTVTSLFIPARINHTAIWTGSEMIVLGGEVTSGGSTQYHWGGRYSPATNTWTDLAYQGLQLRSQHGAVWTGSEMIVLGGTGAGGTLITGGRYNPSSNSWTPTAVEPDYRGTAVWTGSEMIVWGRSSVVNPNGIQPAGLYSPATDSWRASSVVSAPAGRGGHVAVWTGLEMIVWGGVSNNSGGRYNPTTDSWTPTWINNGNDPVTRWNGIPTAIWTGSEMIVWGAFCSVTGPCPGERYSPATNQWTAMAVNASTPEERTGHTAVWTGTEMIVFGGRDFDQLKADYARYNPDTDSWTLRNAPDARAGHSAVWTGTEMILWGGDLQTHYNSTNTGWRYDPAAGPEGQFVPTSTAVGTPAARTAPNAVWTGSEMIVWGGYNYNGGFWKNDGGRYDPATDSWIPTKLDATTPSAEEGYGAVWADKEMIVWSDSGLAGGRYCTCAQPVNFYADVDGDGVGDSTAAAGFCGTPSGGWVASGGDCDGQDSQIWGIPGEARDLSFSDIVTLSWSQPQAPGATSLSYDLIRSPSPANFVGGGLCAVTNTASLEATDAATPAPGSVLCYLVRAENACPGGSGPLGNDSNGIPRSALNCP